LHCIALHRLAALRGKQVQYRAQDHIAVASFPALTRGLRQPKDTFRTRHLYCGFPLSAVPPADLELAERRAEALGDFVLAGHLLRQEPTATWE